MKYRLLIISFIIYSSITLAQSEIVPNGSFDSNSTGWTAVNGFTKPAKASFNYNSTGGNPGGYISIVAAGTNGGTGNWKSSEIVVRPGQTYKLTFDYQANCYNTYVRIDFYSAQNGSGWVGFAAVGDTVLYGIPSLNQATSWTSKSQVLLVPAGANYAVITCWACAQWGTSKFDNVSLQIPCDPSLSISSNTTGVRYIVDSSGQPFQLFGMARGQYVAQYENNTYGSLDDLCKHFKALGCNAIRLAMSLTTEENSNDRIVECGGYNSTGIQNFITKYVDPEVKTIIQNGMYVILDLHEYPDVENVVDIVPYAVDHYIPIWSELAKRYADEPMIAMFELWNEPYAADLGTIPFTGPGMIGDYNWNIAVRNFYIDCVDAVREYDTKHICLLSDWNAGWGTAWPDTWENHEYDADPVYRNVMFSMHAAAFHLDTDFVNYEQWWANVSNNNNVAFHFGEIETEGDLMTTAGMENFVDMLGLRSSTHHYSSVLWRPHNDLANYVSVWTDFAKEYTTWPDTEEISIEPEDSFSGAVHLMTSADYFASDNSYPGGAVQIDASASQYSFGFVNLPQSFGPETYKLRIRTFGDSSNSVTQGIYYEDIDDSSHKLISFIPGRTDQEFHTDVLRFTTAKPFNKIIVKKMDASSAGGNPIDQMVLLRNYQYEAEDATEGGVQTYTNQYASGGAMAGISGSAAIWSYGTLDFGSFLSPGTYTMKIRFYGDSSNTASQGIYYVDENQNHINIAYLSGNSTDDFYEIILTFTSSVPFDKIVFKKSVTSSEGTNPIDCISIIQRFSEADY